MATSAPVKTTKAAKPRKAAQRTGVLVVGMHRSGTSALTRVLNLVGCDLPKTLLGANKTNETGHWESLPICRLDDRILESAGTRWDDWLEFNPGWLQSPKAEEFREEAQQILADEFGSSRLFVLKDPRICRLVGFWTDIFEAADIRPLIILPIRNPLEVAASIQKRNGLETALGLLLWLRHVLDAEFSSRGVSRFFTSYDRVMSGWGQAIEAAQNTLQVSFPRLSNQSTEEIEGFLHESHRHHRESREAVIANPILSEWLRSTYEILSNWSENGERQADHATLDRIRTEFNNASPAFSRLVASGQNSRDKAQKLERNLGDIQAKLAEAETAAARHQEAAKRLDADLVGARQQLTEKDKKLSLSNADAEKRQSDLQNAEKARAELQAKLAQAEASNANHVEKTKALDQALAAARESLAKAEQERSRLRADTAKQAEAATALEAEQAKTTARLAEVETTLKQEAERTKKLSEALEGARNGKTAVERQRDALQAEANQRAEKLAASEKARAESEGSLASLRGQMQTQLEKAREFEQALATARQNQSRADEAYTKLKAEFDKRQVELQAVQKAHGDSQARFADIETASRTQADRAKELEQTLAAVRQERARTVEERDRLKIELASQTDAAKASDTARVEALERLASLEASLQQQQDESKQLSNALGNIRNAKTTAEQEAGRLRAELEKAAGDLDVARRAQTDTQKRVQEAEAESERLRNQMTESEAALSAAVAERLAIAEKAVGLERELAEKSEESERLRTDGERLRDENQSLASDTSERIRQLEEELSIAKWHLGERDQAIADLNAAIHGRAEELKAVNQLYLDTDWRRGELEAKLGESTHQNETLLRQIGAVQQEKSSADETVVRLSLRVQDQAGHIEEAVALAAAREEALSRALDDVQRHMQRSAAIQAELDRQVDENDADKKALAAMRDRLAQTESALAQRRLEAEQTAAELGVAQEQLRRMETMQAESEKLTAGFKEHIDLLMGDVRRYAQRADTIQSELDVQIGENTTHKRVLVAAQERLAETESALARNRLEAEQANAQLAIALEQSRHLEEVRAENDKVTASFKEHIELLMNDVRERQATLVELENANRVLSQQAATASSHLSEANARLELDLSKARSDRSALENQLKDSFKELTTLSKMMGESERGATATREAAAKEVGRAVVALLDNSRWSFVPAKLRGKLKISMLRRSGIFDPAWYLDTYKDVAAAGVDPFWHYVEHGAREGREPNSFLAGAGASGPVKSTP